ncbi:MAG: ABC-F family ATP-binding cassette domain-containing protein [Candidatus Poribacteria bacterium]|nr:ABC-F family ATP-binding cassette domain-containing protein [Candidatus Poribacteria bacterium]
MSLVRLENVTKTHEPHLILDGISWQVNAGERIGLIGANGTGKTTLFDIMVGVQQPTTGAVYRSKGLKVGYFRQISDLKGDTPVRVVMGDAFAEQRRLEVRMHELTEKMASATNDDELNKYLEQYDRFQHEHDVNGGYDYEYRIDSILRGLGFSEEDSQKPVGVLSGGEKSRASLARILLEKPDLILFDEPTNHLDVHAIEWLESFLRLDYSGTIVVISHDRYFLDRVTTKTVELRNHNIKEYKGSYSLYIELREVEMLTNIREWERQQKFIAKEEEFIRRNIAGQNTREAQGRRKRLARLERIEKLDNSARSMRLQTQTDKRSGNDVMYAIDLAKRFGDETLFEGVDFEVSRGDMLGIMGPNGAGKSTLFKMILGVQKPDAGEVIFGSNVEIGYLDQEHRDLDSGKRVQDEIWNVMPLNATIGDIRSYLAPFLFTGDDLEKRVGVLSGGERTRLTLAKLMLKKPNLLMLDEPTNHLDIPSREALENCLLDYDGTVILITHDRYLLSKLATKLVIFEPDSVIYWRYPYDDWEQHKAQQAADAKQANNPPPKPQAQPTSNQGNQSKKANQKGKKGKSKNRSSR